MLHITSLEQYFNFKKAFDNGVHIPRIFMIGLGNLNAAALLSQILYWTSPDKKGKSRLRVKKINKETGEETFWLAKKREDWKAEICLSPDEYDNAIKKLLRLGIVEVKKFKFDGSPTTHVRIVKDVFLQYVNEWIQAMPKKQNNDEEDQDESIPPSQNENQENAQNNDTTKINGNDLHLQDSGKIKTGIEPNTDTELPKNPNFNCQKGELEIPKKLDGITENPHTLTENTTKITSGDYFNRVPKKLDLNIGGNNVSSDRYIHGSQVGAYESIYSDFGEPGSNLQQEDVNSSNSKDRSMVQNNETSVTSQPSGFPCENCGRNVPPGVANFSRKNFDGHVLCMDCQKKNQVLSNCENCGLSVPPGIENITKNICGGHVYCLNCYQSFKSKAVNH